MLLSNSKQIYLKKKKKKQLSKQRKTNNTLKIQVKVTTELRNQVTQNAFTLYVTNSYINST